MDMSKRKICHCLVCGQLLYTNDSIEFEVNCWKQGKSSKFNLYCHYHCCKDAKNMIECLDKYVLPYNTLLDLLEKRISFYDLVGFVPKRELEMIKLASNHSLAPMLVKFRDFIESLSVSAFFGIIVSMLTYFFLILPAYFLSNSILGVDISKILSEDHGSLMYIPMSMSALATVVLIILDYVGKVRSSIREKQFFILTNKLLSAENKI